MKTIKGIIIAVIFLMSSIAYANVSQTTYSNVKLKIVNSNLVKITVKAEENESLKLEVLNNKGEKVLSGNIEENKTKRFSHKLDALNDGFYTYVVSDQNKALYTSRVVLTQDGAVEYKPENAMVSATIRKISEERVIINLAKEKDSEATIKVWDESGKELYAKQVKRGTVLRLTHDYSDFPEGTYSFGIFYNGELIALRKVTK